MSHWILTCNPAKWHIEDFRADGRTSTVWTIGQHWRRVSVGDDIAIWRTGGHRGIIPRGVVSAQPFYGSAAPEGERYWARDQERERQRWLLPIRIHTYLFDDPISAKDFEHDDRFWLLAMFPHGRSGL